MSKLKLYLETSIFNFAFSEQNPDYRQATLTLLDSVKQAVYEAYISEAVVREITEAPKEKVAKMMKLISDLEPESLDINTDIEELAEGYIKAGLIPARYIDDALHIAIASFYELDVVLSWNFEHMVKLKTKKGVVAVNALTGYKPIEILSPLEVI
jgi:predicted nucleic acid-binding protein